MRLAVCAAVRVRGSAGSGAKGVPTRSCTVCATTVFEESQTATKTTDGACAIPAVSTKAMRGSSRSALVGSFAPSRTTWLIWK